MARSTTAARNTSIDLAKRVQVAMVGAIAAAMDHKKIASPGTNGGFESNMKKRKRDDKDESKLKKRRMN